MASALARQRTGSTHDARHRRHRHRHGPSEDRARRGSRAALDATTGTVRRPRLRTTRIVQGCPSCRCARFSDVYRLTRRPRRTFRRARRLGLTSGSARRRYLRRLRIHHRGAGGLLVPLNRSLLQIELSRAEAPVVSSFGPASPQSRLLSVEALKRLHPLLGTPVR